MGFLDDAIREHLELKRRHGADPSDLARQEREALGPLGRQRTREDPSEVPFEGLAPEDQELLRSAEPPPEFTPGLRPDASERLGTHEMGPVPGVDLPLDGAEEPEPEAPPPPGRRRGRLRFGRHREPERPPAESQAPPEPPDDVLEETPDFLRETPEHERLWFEQRPPRDFDFDG